MIRYESYSSTGVKWLGAIPTTWECKKIGSLFSERKTKVSDKDYIPLSVAKIGVVPQLETAVKTDAGDNRKLVCAGDFVINSRSDRKGSCGVSELNGSVSLINIVLKPRQAWNNRYVHYLLRSPIFSEEFYRYGRGIVADLWTTRCSEMKNIFLPVPPRSEQDQIVRYLDWQVSKINKLIAAKKKEIALISELKKTIVNAAVTHGLNPNVPMKFSGVEWLGDIPEHWTLTKIKQCARLSTEKTTEKKDNYVGMENIQSWAGEANYVQNFSPESASNIFHEKDVLFGKLRPYLAKAAIMDREGICSGEFLVLKDFTGYNKFLLNYLLSYKFIDIVNSSTYGAKMPRANWDFIGNCEIPIPPIDEQCAIAKYLDNVSKSIKNYVAIMEIQIDKLNELKNKLISDVVTGQVDVRGIEVPDFEYVEDIDDDSAAGAEPTEESESEGI